MCVNQNPASYLAGKARTTARMHCQRDFGGWPYSLFTAGAPYSASKFALEVLSEALAGHENERLVGMISRRDLIGISAGLLASKSNAASWPPAKAKRGMVSTEYQLATDVGLEILKRGGNAVDAAV